MIIYSLSFLIVNESAKKMIIGIIKETSPHETRTCLTPQTAEKLITAGFSVKMEQNVGLKSCFRNSEYVASGVEILTSPEEVLKKCDIWLTVNTPDIKFAKLLKNNSLIIGNLQNDIIKKFLPLLNSRNIKCLALNQIPRLSKAQGFDILSSQNNLSGYQSIFKAARFLPSTLPLMITSAGTLAPAKILIIGVGVAGLQAIATAKRLGAKVYAYDINQEVKEQAESVGAKFINDFHSVLNEVNIIITAVTPAHSAAPKIITADILESLPDHCVLIDLASAQGGNIENSADQKITRCQNCIIYGDSALSREIPHAASTLLANNFYNFLMYIFDQEKQQIKLNSNDEIIQSVIMKG